MIGLKMTLTISKLVSQIESNNVPYAMRFEPGWRHDNNIITMVRQAHAPAYMNTTTAKTIMATSYGLYQIMGENIYRLGYKKPINEFMNSPNDQLDIFNKFLSWRGIDYTVNEIFTNREKMEKFARRYNGSLAYIQTLMNGYNYLNLVK